MSDLGTKSCVSVAEFAALPEVSVHPETVRSWIKLGLIPAKRVGPRLLRIPRQEALEKLGRNPSLKSPSAT